MPSPSARNLLEPEIPDSESFLLNARAQTLKLQSFSVKLEMILLGGGTGSVAPERNLLGVESFLLEGRVQAVESECFRLGAEETFLAIEQNTLGLE